MEIFYHSKFIRQFKKLHSDIKTIAAEKEIIFKNDPFDSRLKTHKLHGKLSGYLSFSINYKYRIIFSFIDNKNIKFYSIGTHDIYEN